MKNVDWQEVARVLERELLRRNMSSQRLADRAGVDRKTVDRLRKGGRVRMQTLNWVQQALGAPLFDPERLMEPAMRVARSDLGGYTQENFARYEGDYYGFRYSFDQVGRVVCYHMRISWSDVRRGLVFAERQRNTDVAGRLNIYEFRGEIGVPAGLNVLNFMIVGGGAARIASASFLRETEETYMRGVLNALNEVAEVGFYPVVTPFCLIKCARAQTEGEIIARIGVSAISDLWKPGAADMLRDAGRRFIVLEE